MARKPIKEEIAEHVDRGEHLQAAKAALREHYRRKNGVPQTPEEELDADALGNLRDALDYLEQGNYELAMHHAWRAQVRIAQRGRLSGVECLDEQGVWQCIEMCRGHDEQRRKAETEKDQAFRERDEAHGHRLREVARAEDGRRRAEEARETIRAQADALVAGAQGLARQAVAERDAARAERDQARGEAEAARAGLRRDERAAARAEQAELVELRAQLHARGQELAQARAEAEQHATRAARAEQELEAVPPSVVAAVRRGVKHKRAPKV